MKAIEPEPLADPSLEPSGSPVFISKRVLEEVLLAAGLPSSVSVKYAQEQFPPIGPIRSRLIEQFDGGPGLCEFEADRLALAESWRLKGWPAWYIRLPDEWRDDVPRLVAWQALSPHLLRDEQDPWYVAQQVAIVSDFLGDCWFSTARRIDIDDRLVHWTISRGWDTGGLLVLFECAGTISITVYPVDEFFVCALQAGDGASSRHPLFDLSMAEVQALTRAIEDGAGPARDPNVVRLPVTRFENAEAESAALGWPACFDEVAHRLSPRVQCSLHYGGTVGPVSRVIAWYSAEWSEEGGHWLRLTLSWAMHNLCVAEPPMTKVEFLRADEDAPDMVLVTVACGQYLYAAELRLGDASLYQTVKAIAEAGWCWLVLENELNGRSLRMKLRWPVKDLPETMQGETSQVAQDIVEAPEHPAVYARAQALMQERGESVFLYRSLVQTTD